MAHFQNRKKVHRGDTSVALAVPAAGFHYDGMTVRRRTKAPKRRLGLSLRQIVPLVAIFFLFRIILAADMGAAGYQAKVATLAEGNTAEQAVAMILPLDPVSEAAAGGLATVIAIIAGR